MANTRLVMGDGVTYSATACFQPLATGAACGTGGSGISTETQAQVIYRTAGVFKNFQVQVTNWSTTTQVMVTRKGAASQNLTVTVNATGTFEDTGHTDTVTAADKWDISTAAGNSGTRTDSLAVTFTANVGTVCRVAGITISTGDTVGSSSSTVFYNICGLWRSIGTEANAQLKLLKPGVFKNAYINVVTNTDFSTSSLNTRKGGANQNISIAIGTSGTTGIIEDTTHTDNVSVNDLWCFGLTTGASSVNLVSTSGGLDFSSTSGDSFTADAASSAGGTASNTGGNFSAMAGGQQTHGSVEGTTVTARSVYIMSNLSCNVLTNTFTTATLSLRKNTANGNQVINSVTTGQFADTTHTDSVVATDKLDYDFNTTGTASASISFYAIYWNQPAGVFYPNVFSTIGLRPGMGPPSHIKNTPGELSNLPPMFSTY